MLGIGVEMAAARVSAALGPCRHGRVVPVDLVVTGETVALLCEDCLVRLPVGWNGDVVEVLDGGGGVVAYLPDGGTY